MYDEKAWYQSRTVWGGLIAVLAAVAGAFGFSIGGEDQAALVEAVAAVAGAAGGIVAIWGRVKATKSIT
ncbi:MAG: hypothetical protein O2782_23420 [bacterium]|nr:hypothetical protein [bacterium]